MTYSAVQVCESLVHCTSKLVCTVNTRVEYRNRFIKDFRLEPELRNFKHCGICFQIFTLDSCHFQQDEAKRWKDRGNKLSKDSSSVDMAIRCYSLALKYAPLKEKELIGTILSNRCSMYIKKGDNEAALKDARQSVKYKPDWAKVTIHSNLCT